MSPPWRAARSAVCDAAALAVVLRPRDGVVAEQVLPPLPGAGAPPPGAEPPPPGAGPLPPGAGRAGASYRFAQVEGPLDRYQRRVAVVPAPNGEGAWVVTQEVEATIGLAPVAWLFAVPLRRRLARIGPEPPLPWWLPPVRLPRRAAVVLVTLCALEVLVGYLSDLLPYTMTYAGSEFGVGSTGQGVALGVSRVAALGALAALAVADRRGRRPVLLVALAAGALLCASGALAPSLWSLTATQVAAGALASAAAVLVAVIAAEEMPAGTRAWALGVIGMCFGLGSGLALAALPLAGAGRGGWRWIFALAVGVVPLTAVAARWLPESQRFTASTAHHRPTAGLRRHERRTLLLLGAGAFLLALFADPGGALQNQYLRHERHLSPLGISVLLQVAGTVGGLGTLVGGRLADTRGRRPVAAGGVLILTATTVAVYFSGGAALWWWEIASSAASYGIGPALAVYGAELFPTAVRGRAGGALTVLGSAGGLCGLGAAGVLSSRLGATGPALALLAAGPVLLAVLVLAAYPETASRSLEELNPSDAPADARAAQSRDPSRVEPG